MFKSWGWVSLSERLCKAMRLCYELVVDTCILLKIVQPAEGISL